MIIAAKEITDETGIKGGVGGVAPSFTVGWWGALDRVAEKETSLRKGDGGREGGRKGENGPKVTL